MTDNTFRATISYVNHENKDVRYTMEKNGDLFDIFVWKNDEYEVMSSNRTKQNAFAIFDELVTRVGLMKSHPNYNKNTFYINYKQK